MPTPRNIHFWYPVYDGEETPESTSPESTTTPPTGGNDEYEGKFTDEQKEIISKIVQKRVSRTKTEAQEVIQQLEQLKRTKQMTDEERDKLQQRIDNLEKSVLTKEELAAKQRKEIESQHEQQLSTLQGDVNTWRNLYETSTIERSIVDAASSEEAFQPNQIVTLLRGQTKLVEETVDGKSTGRLVPRVTFLGRDSDGKSMEMDLAVNEAIKEMKKMPDQYGNLFKSGLTGGVGGTNVPGDGEITDSVLSSQESYEKYRQKIRETV
jgi:hypothetical protein